MAVAGSPRPGSELGTAVGLVRVPRNVQGPAQPEPTNTCHPPPLGFMKTACPPDTLIDDPATEKGDPEVTMTELPSFSVSATRTSVDSWPDVRVLRLVPP